MRRALLFSILLLDVDSCSAGLSCDFRSAESLTSCVRGILEASHSALKELVDPMRIVDLNGTGPIDWALTGVQVHGLGTFEIQNLQIKHSAPLLLTVKLDFKWPQVVGTGAGWFRACGKIFNKPQCVSFTAKPRLDVLNATADMETHLHLSLRDEGLRVMPTGTLIKFGIPKLKVTVNLNGFLRFLDQMLKNPSDKYAQRLAESWWSKNRETLQKKAEEHLNRLIDRHLSPNLGAVLKGIGK